MICIMDSFVKIYLALVGYFVPYKRCITSYFTQLYKNVCYALFKTFLLKKTLNHLLSWTLVKKKNVYSESEFNEFEPRLKCAKNGIKLNVSLNLKTLNTIFCGTNHIWAASQIKTTAQILYIRPQASFFLN